MARWKCRLLINCNWTSFSISYCWGATRKNVKTHCLLERVGQLERRFRGEGVVPPEYILVSTKLETFCYLTAQTAPCYVQSFWHNIGVWQTDRWTDGWTDGRTEVVQRIAARCKNFTILHCFWHITTSKLYITARNLQKSFTFDMTVKLTGHVYFPICIETYCK